MGTESSLLSSGNNLHAFHTSSMRVICSSYIFLLFWWSTASRNLGCGHLFILV